MEAKDVKALDYLVRLGRSGFRENTIEVAGRQLLFSPAENRYNEVIPYQPAAREPRLGSIEAIVEYAKRHGDPVASAFFVSPSEGIRLRLDERVQAPAKSEDVTIPFFRQDSPPAGWVYYGDILDYLDRLTGFIDNEDALRVALKSVSAFKKSKVTLTDHGAGIRVDMTDSRGVNEDVNLPKFVVFHLRVFTHEITMSLRCKLMVEAEAGSNNVRFRLLPQDREGSIVAATAEVIQRLRSGLGEDWLIVEGA